VRYLYIVYTVHYVHIYLSSLNQHLMHRLSSTKSHCLTNTPTRFRARRPLLRGVPLFLLHFAARRMIVNNCPAMCCGTVYTLWYTNNTLKWCVWSDDDVIWTFNRRSDHHEVLEIVYRERRLQFPYTWSDSCLKPFDVLKNLTVKTAIPEDGAYERRNASEF